MVLKFGTIFGAQLGFEFLTGNDFASVDLPVNWALLINLFCVRVTITSFKDE